VRANEDQEQWNQLPLRFLVISAQECQSGICQSEVVKELLDAEGRELVMLTADDGDSRRIISAENEHLDVVDEDSCLIISAENEHLDVVKPLLEVGGREIPYSKVQNSG
jgi:hypothetical protein